ETARLDPPHPAARKNNAVLHIVLAPPFAEGLTTKSIQAASIFRMQPLPPLTARRIGCPLGQPVDSHIPSRDLHLAVVDIVTVAANKGSHPRQVELRVAFSEHLLSPLVMSDVAGHAEQSYRSALSISQNRALNRDPSRLTRMRMVKRRHHPVLSGPGATGMHCFCLSSVYAREVFGTNETPRLVES